jgi:hypothetical protein
MLAHALHVLLHHLLHHLLVILHGTAAARTHLCDRVASGGKEPQGSYASFSGYGHC